MSKSILIVDDSALVRRLTRSYLEAQSFQVCGEASDGIEGVAKAQELAPDLIVMDLSMPRMDGLEAARRIKRNTPLVPIILFTLHKDTLRTADVDAAGISAVVSKTEGQDVLASAIVNVLAAVA